jgi:MFS family permease
MGALIILFMTVHPGSPAYAIVPIAFALGFASSLQYTCINTLVFADLTDADTSPGSSISSTVQQMSMSFGVAVASLLAAVFLGGENRLPALETVKGIHWTFLTLGLMTIVSASLFRTLREDDGESVSKHHVTDRP